MPRFRHGKRARLLLTATALTLLQPALALADARPLTLDAIFASEAFDNPLPRDRRWLPDGNSITYIDADTGALMQRKVGDQGVSTLLPATALRYRDVPLQVSAAQWSPDIATALLHTGTRSDWQGASHSICFVYDARTGELRPLAGDGQAVQHAELSPDGRRAAYVLDNDLYVMDTRDGTTTRITRDGSDDIFNGVFDYGSTEFGGSSAWRWSPDSSRIAFWRLDATAVPTFPLIDELGNYSQVRRFHYPNTGQPHAINQVGVYDLASGETRWLETGQPADDYLPRLNWGSAGRYLFVQHLTRDHKTLRLLRFNLEGGGFDVPLTDTDPAWIDITDDFTALPGTDGDFLWTSERSGYRHIYHYRDGELAPLTSGDWSVGAIVGFAPRARAVYFYAKKDSLVDQHVYRLALDDGEVERVSTEPGWHEWQLAPDGAHALVAHSTARSPRVLSLRDNRSGNSEILVANDIEGMRDFELADTEFIQFDTSDGVTLNGYFIKPPDFDPNRQYPVIGYAYGNAGSQIVVNRWGTQRGAQQDLWHRYMAQQGYVIFAMDNRTTTGRGKRAKNLTYGHYGKYAVLDELQGVDYLKTLPWVDADRIGFWGWSGGGYLAAALMTKGAPHFKAAVSVAPVIDLTRYQAVGVERWMGTPEENPDGYAAVNLMNYADRLQGKLLLMHGTGDENVKFAFTLQLVDALIAADKQFDMVVYPNRRHTISDARKHVFTTMSRYFQENL